MLVRRRGFRVVAGVAVLALAATACASSKNKGTPSASTSSEPTSGRITGDPNKVNTAASLKQGGTLTYTIEKNITNWNINTSDGNTLETAIVMQAVEPGAFNLNPDTSNTTLNTDMFASAEQTSTSPQTIVYKIQPNAVWNDGVPISADDFVYFWKAQNGKDCPTCDINSTTGYDQIQSITGSDNDKTVTVVYTKPFGDWKSLFGASYGLLPSHLVKDMPLEQGWDHFFAGVPKWSAGPYQISNWQDNTAATLVPNPKWYGKTKPHLDKLVIRVITDATQEPTALQSHEVDAIYAQPEVDLLNTVSAIPNVKYQLDLGLTFEHFDFNLTNPFLKDVKVRQAMFTALNVQQMIDKTVGQFDKDVKPIGNRILVPQQDGYQDNVSSFGYSKGDTAAATKLLTDAGYKIVGGKLMTPSGAAFPTLRLRYTVGNKVRQTECEIFKAAVAPLGINISVESTDSLGGTLTHKDAQHDYDVIVFAWVATPFFASSNQAIYSTGGGGNYGKYSNPQVDSLFTDAAASSDHATQIKDVNAADKLLSQDAYTLPLYQKPTFLAYINTIGNIRDNATAQGPTYNVGEWGFKS